MLVLIGAGAMIGGLIAMFVGAPPLFEKWNIIEKYAPVGENLSDAAYAHMMAMAAERNFALVYLGGIAFLAGLILVMTALIQNRLPPPAPRV